MNLREARQDRKLTQERLAELSGVDQTTISNLEVGRIQSPAWETVCRLARVLDIPPEELFPVADCAEVTR